jgi:hypothetical protein
MKSSIAKKFGFVALAAVLLLGGYVGTYLFIVKRSVSDGYGGDPSTPTYHYVAVGADLGGAVTRILFRPALNIDRRYIRRRYWEGSYVVETPAGTNIVYESDMTRYEAEHHK